jgi:NADH-quinone oxidoreductase subunit F
MKKLASVEDFAEFRSQIVNERKSKDDDLTLVVCAGTGGQASGSNDVIRRIKRYILDKGLQAKIRLRVTGCQGFCEMDPFILVQPGKHLYTKLKMDDVPRVIEASLKGHVLEDLLYREPFKERRYECQDDIPFFKGQTRTLLGNNERLDPIRLTDYIAQGGYAALERALSKHDPEWIVREVLKSGLRGRGGAGFPTGKKWELAQGAGDCDEQKYIVCNADEGDPGAYMDRSLLEGNPHAIIEGMAIAGIAIGATQGFIYVRSEYPLAIKHTIIALGRARDLGLLGENILGTGVDFDIDIIRGAGAFVCGEETAMIRSIEGLMGEPRQRPPYPIDSGIYGHPTCINNVETLANVPVIISQGAEEYAKVGVPGNTGTKIFSLVGKIRNTGLVEVPLGTKISDVVYEIGGGAPGEARIKAVQTGGPSGGCIPASMFDLPIDYDRLTRAGSIMGSGGMIVMDENTCMVDVAKYFMNFLKDESCGKCYTCRKGTQRMYEILDDITRGKATLEHLDLVEELALVVQDTTMCGLGQTASNPVLSTLKYFRDEYERHILQKKCDAFVCKELVGAPCGTACPVGTEAWRYVAHIARGEMESAYRSIREPNPFPSICARVCHHPCELRCTAGTTGNRPIAIRALKRFITDHIDPSVYEPPRVVAADDTPKVAVVGGGPAGLSAAHCLSLLGYAITLYEADAEPGGMLLSCIPAYRLPREVLRKEIQSLLDENLTLKCNAALGRDFTVDDLFRDGFKAVFLAVGASKSRRLGLEGEDVEGCYPAMKFLRSFNLQGQNLARGHVGVIGGGNSAVDSARVALRQEGVKSVTIIYRRGRDEMPAFGEEIDAAAQEGIKLETLVSPVEVLSENGMLTGIKCIRNQLGNVDSSGRRRPVPVAGTEFTLPLDTLVVAISEDVDSDFLGTMGIDAGSGGKVLVSDETLVTNREGVFAGGDAVTGPNTVVDAIAAGKRAAIMIDKYIRGEPLQYTFEARLPEFYLEAVEVSPEEAAQSVRVEPSVVAPDERKRSFCEVEMTMSAKSAEREARRCLRCDLEFTQPKEEVECAAAGGNVE